LKKHNNPRNLRGFFRLRSLMSALFAGALFLSVTSCNEYDSIGLDLVDQPLSINSTDTISLVAFTAEEKPLITSQNSFLLLGFNHDPLFGKTRASIHTELLPVFIPPQFVNIHRDSLVVDSVVLSFGYAGYAGNPAIPQRLRVYELGEIIPRDTVYSDRALNIRREITVNNPVQSFRPNPRDSVMLGNDTVPNHPPHLRINLDREFGRRFIITMDSLREQNAGFTTGDQFREYLKGFHVTVDESDIPGGAILYFNINSAYTGFLIYYRKLGNENGHTYQIALNNPTGRRYNQYENFGHESASGLITAQLQGDTLQGDSLLFLQAMANYRVKLQIPHIAELFENRQGSFAINSARLVLPIDEAFPIDSVSMARQLIILRENPENREELIFIDDQLVDLSIPGYFGGVYSAKDKAYVFNITRHLQMILDNPNLNTPLYVRVSGSSQNAGRVVLKGPGRVNPMKLEIRYTQLISK
jgi:hypothetical protein